MPENVTSNVTVAIAGVSYSQAISATGTNVERATPTVSAAKAGSLTTWTDANTGTFTMDPGHGFTTSDLIDLFWSGGSRRNMTATVTGDSVVLDGGSGDNLPVVSTAITAMLPTQVAFSADATSTGVAVAANCPVNGWVVFRNSTTVLVAYQIRADILSNVWVTGLGTNPLASLAVTNVLFSHASTSSQTMAAAVVF